MIIPGLLRLKESNTISPYICYMLIFAKKMTNYRSKWGRLLPICRHRELPSWTCTNCVRGVLNGNGWDPFLCIQVDFYGDLSHHLQ